MSYEEVVTFENLYKAMRKCRNGVAWKDTVARYTADGLKETYRLRQDLLNGTYKIKPYQLFIVTDPKRREVKASNIRDRQFQKSLCRNGLYNDLTKSLIRDNYACQKNRGVDDALNRMGAHLHRYYRKHGSTGWVLKCDIRHYFAETDHEIAKAVVRKRVADDRVCKAVDQIIDSFGENEGIGLGSEVSQLIELSVLDDLDHFIKERLRIKHYLRYMDDFILIHPDKEYLSYCLREITKRLDAIGLKLNKKTQLFPIKHGIIWLKWRFILTDTGKVIRKISSKSISREKRKLRNLKRLLDQGKITADVPLESIKSWEAAARRGNTDAVIADMWKYYHSLFHK